MRLRGEIIIRKDFNTSIPAIDLCFENYFLATVRVWPSDFNARNISLAESHISFSEVIVNSNSFKTKTKKKKSIQVLCCDHVLWELIKHNVSFKFSTRFGQCDCESHREILVGKCYITVITVFTVQKKCNCAEKFTCGFCLIKCFILNQLVQKNCFKDEWINATSTLKPLDVFLNKIYCDKFICKFIYNSEIKKCEHVVLPKEDVESSSL